MRILKFAFWMSVVVIFLPASNDNDKSKGIIQQSNATLSVSDVANAAASMGKNISTFCSQSTDVCKTGAAALVAFKAQAETGLHLMAPNLDGSANQPAAIVNAAKPVIEKAANHLAQKIAQATSETTNTLKIEDLIPEWKAPGKANKS